MDIESDDESEVVSSDDEIDTRNSEYLQRVFSDYYPSYASVALIEWSTSSTRNIVPSLSIADTCIPLEMKRSNSSLVSRYSIYNEISHVLENTGGCKLGAIITDDMSNPDINSVAHPLIVTKCMILVLKSAFKDTVSKKFAKKVRDNAHPEIKEASQFSFNEFSESLVYISANDPQLFDSDPAFNHYLNVSLVISKAIYHLEVSNQHVLESWFIFLNLLQFLKVKGLSDIYNSLLYRYPREISPSYLYETIAYLTPSFFNFFKHFSQVDDEGVSSLHPLFDKSAMEKEAETLMKSFGASNYAASKLWESFEELDKVNLFQVYPHSVRSIADLVDVTLEYLKSCDTSASMDVFYLGCAHAMILTMRATAAHSYHMLRKTLKAVDERLYVKGFHKFLLAAVAKSVAAGEDLGTSSTHPLFIEFTSRVKSEYIASHTLSPSNILHLLHEPIFDKDFCKPRRNSQYTTSTTMNRLNSEFINTFGYPLCDLDTPLSSTEMKQALDLNDMICKWKYIDLSPVISLD